MHKISYLLTNYRWPVSQAIFETEKLVLIISLEKIGCITIKTSCIARTERDKNLII